MGEKAAEIIRTVWWLPKTVQKTMFNKFSGCVPFEIAISSKYSNKIQIFKAELYWHYIKHAIIPRWYFFSSRL